MPGGAAMPRSVDCVAGDGGGGARRAWRLRQDERRRGASAGTTRATVARSGACTSRTRQHMLTDATADTRTAAHRFADKPHYVSLITAYCIR
jgi:hypothetical protein